MLKVARITNGMTDPCCSRYAECMSSDEPAGRRKISVGIPQRVGPWQVRMNWPDDEDQIGPVSITITAAPDATDDELIGGLSSTVLRHIDFRRARENWLAVRKIRPQKKQHITWKDNWRAEQLQQLLARDGVSEEYLAFLAEAYLVLVQFGERSVAATLAEMTGRSPDTMKQHLHKVRKAGMLTAIPGKAGGKITPKAIMAIRQATEGVGSDDSESEREFAERLAAQLAES